MLDHRKQDDALLFCPRLIGSVLFIFLSVLTGDMACASCYFVAAHAVRHPFLCPIFYGHQTCMQCGVDGQGGWRLFGRGHQPQRCPTVGRFQAQTG